MTAGERLRVATALHSPLLGGSQLGTIELAAELRRRGHQVDMFVIDDEVEVSVLPVAREAGFDVEVLPQEPSLLRQARHIRRFVRDHDAQVLHVYNEHYWLGALAALALRDTPSCAPVVTNWMMEHHPWIPPHAPLIVGFDNLVERSKRVRRGPVWLLEPPVNTELDRPGTERGARFRAEHRIDDDQLAVMVIGRVEPVMKLDGILRTISAAEGLDDDSLRFVIVGDGEAMDVVKGRVAEVNDRLGRNAVEIVGALEDPRPAYEAADIVLAMGAAALRGLAFAKPVVVLGLGSFSRVFEPDSLPYFIDRGFYGSATGDDGALELMAQLRSLLDADRRERLGAFGKETIDDHYALDVMAARLEDIYRAAIDDPLSTVERSVDAAWALGYGLIRRVAAAPLREAFGRRLRGIPRRSPVGSSS